MPDTAALRARAAATAEVVARFGHGNLEAILDVYRAFAGRVDYRELVSWTLKDPLEDLLLPVFLRALVEITKTLDLGELAGRLKVYEAGEWEWGVRSDGPHGSRVSPAADEHDARNYASGPAETGRTYTVVRRRIGPWTEVPE